MDIDLIRRTVQERLEKEGTGHDYQHILRVEQLANKIIDEEKVSHLREVIIIAVLVHDLVDEKLITNEEKAADQVRSLLKKAKLEDQMIEEILEIIRHQSFSKNIDQKQTLSLAGQIVQDADRLDAIGAVAIARAFYYSGAKGQTIYTPQDGPRSETLTHSSYRANNSARQHFYDKLLKLEGLMNTHTGKNLARQRTRYIEAYVSIMANDYSDSLALRAIQMVFEYLERSVKGGDYEAREKMHNASTIAGMAFGNAFLGISHSMAHKVGGIHHTVHGRTNAILLPYVIRYNGSKPGKMSTWPKYNYYKADKKYQTIAALLGLPASSPEEGVASLAQAVYDLGEKVGIKMNFKEQGIDEKTWQDSLDEIAFLAYEDQCTPVNPRLALVKDMKEILENAYYGYKERPGRIK